VFDCNILSILLRAPVNRSCIILFSWSMHV